MKILLIDGVECIRVPNTEHYYVSADARIFKLKDGEYFELSQWISSGGYPQVKFNRKDYFVHRAVALAWVDGDTTVDVNHKDGNKQNNHKDNLEWITRRGNLKHALHNGLHALKETPVIGTNLKTGEEVYFSCQADVKELGFLQPLVNKCLKGHRLFHKGHTWRYA